MSEIIEDIQKQGGKILSVSLSTVLTNCEEMSRFLEKYVYYEVERKYNQFEEV